MATRMNQSDAATESVIPVIDINGLDFNDCSAVDQVAEQLRYALENIGFYYLSGHGISRHLSDAVFEQCARFHRQPLEDKMALRANKHNIGYMPVNGYVSRSSKVEVATRPNLVEALFVKRDLAPDHPDVIADRRYRGANQWPHALPGFKEIVVEYCEAMEQLCQRMLSVYARALDLPIDFFAEGFREPQYTLRMSHYPPSETGAEDQYGVAPHTDSSFLTMLAQSELPGLAIKLPSDEWIDAPVIDGAIVVNSGDMLRRWTNHRFLSTPHRVINRNPGRDRYAIPFFFDATIDYKMTCLPTCQSESNPARYEPTSYEEYMRWFTQQYDHIRDAEGSRLMTSPLGN